MKCYGLFFGLIGIACHAEYAYENIIDVEYYKYDISSPFIYDLLVIKYLPFWFVKYLPLEEACVEGICEGTGSLMQQVVQKVKQQRKQFLVERVLAECAVVIDGNKPYRILAGILACCSVFCAASTYVNFSSLDKVTACYGGIMSLVFAGGAYLVMQSEHKAVAHNIFKKLITLDPALFIIKNNDLARRRWRYIKKSIDDQQLITKVENFLHLT